MRIIDADELLKAIDSLELLTQDQSDDTKLVEQATLARLYEIINDAPTVKEKE